MATRRRGTGSGGLGRRLVLGGGTLAFSANILTASLTPSERTSGVAPGQAAAVALAAVGGGTAARTVAGPSGGFLVCVLTTGGQWAHVIEDAEFTVRAVRVERPDTSVDSQLA